MTRSPNRNAFTLIEMITVIAIIAILAGLILAVNGLVQGRAARAKAETDIRALTAAITNYMTDNGGYPQDDETDKVNPRTDFDPKTYQKASLSLYKALIGDSDGDGKTDTGAKNYAPDFFKGSRLGFLTAPTDPNSTKADYIKDPFANSYGYSTSGLKIEQQYQVDLQTKPETVRSTATKGYNPTFDLWTTCGVAGGDTAKWVKNW